MNNRETSTDDFIQPFPVEELPRVDPVPDTRILVEKSLIRYSVIKDISGLASIKDLVRPEKIIMLIKETMVIVEKYSNVSENKIPGDEKKKIVRDVIQEIIRKTDVSENTRESMLVIFGIIFSDTVECVVDISKNGGLLNKLKNKSEFFKKMIEFIKKILKLAV
jgi:hypothetical protein